MQHRPVRRWWQLWTRRCACGCEWYPCPDSRPDAPEPTGEQVAQALGLNQRPVWDGPTRVLPNVSARSLLTPGQAWRSRQSNRHRQR